MKKLTFLALIAFIIFNIKANKTTYVKNYIKECCSTLSRENYLFQAEFSALGLKPSASNLHFAAEALPLPAPSPNWNIFDIHPGYHFGFDLGFKIINNSSNNFFVINWEHFRSCNSNRIAVATENMVGPFFEIGPDASGYSISSARVKFNFNEVNIDFGHDIKLDCGLNTNIFAGIGITSISQCLDFAYSNTNLNINRSILCPNNFLGAGPQLGASFSYNFCNNFYFDGKGLFTLLAGTLKNHTDYVSNSPFLAIIGAASPNKQKTCVQKRTALVPAFEEKLGLAYQFNFRQCYFAKIEVGYQAQVYIGSLQSIDIGSEVVTPPVIPDTVGVYARTFARNISNFALFGPYATIDITF